MRRYWSWCSNCLRWPLFLGMTYMERELLVRSCRCCCGGCPSGLGGGSAGRCGWSPAGRKDLANCAQSVPRSTHPCYWWSVPQIPRTLATLPATWFAASRLPYIYCPSRQSPLRVLQLRVQLLEEGVCRWDYCRLCLLWFLLFESAGVAVDPLGLFLEVEIDLQPSLLAILLMKHFNNKIITHLIPVQSALLPTSSLFSW